VDSTWSTVDRQGPLVMVQPEGFMFATWLPLSLSVVLPDSVPVESCCEHGVVWSHCSCAV
jgi:hypothetical protein